MKLLKRFSATILSLSILASPSFAGAYPQMNTAAAEDSVRYSSVINKWESNVTKESSKLPKDHYWNHKGKTSWDENTYSDTACNNKAEDCEYCTETPYTAPYLTNWSQLGGQKKTYIHCSGFAYKLAKDIWGTDLFVRHDAKNGKYDAPRIGDNVRLEFKTTLNGKEYTVNHSLFITDISDDIITFADCNSDLGDCRIRWGATEYYSTFKIENDRTNGYDPIPVTKEYLKKYAIYYERPILKGDFDLNDKIDKNDVDHFKTTYIDKGIKTNGIPSAIYDVNSDGKITEADYKQIQYYANLSYVDGYLFGTGNPVSYYDRTSVPDGCFVCNNGIYKPIGNTATFIKPFYTDTTSYVVSSSVRDKNNKSYTVTSIGDDYNSPSSLLANLQSIVIPSTVTTIKKFTFSNSGISRISFNGSSSNLKTIETYAFYSCHNLTSLDLRYCPDLSLIENYAFDSCDNLNSIKLPYYLKELKLGTSDTIFGYDKQNKTTIYVNNLKNSATPASNYQKLKFYGSKDLTYWTNDKIELNGKLFEVYYKDQFLCKKGTISGPLSHPQ